MTPNGFQDPLFPHSPATSAGEDFPAGFTGVSPAEGHDASAFALTDAACPTLSTPLVICQSHGILTGESSPSWPEFGTAYFAAYHPQVLTVNTEYFELPLPRLAALRNPGRARRLVRRVKTLSQYGVELRPREADIAFVSHSNGAVLALQACRELINSGWAVRSLVMIAPAVRTKDATREIAGWMDRGMLGSCLLVRPMKDRVIGSIGRSWRTKLVAWPWGSLGVDDWAAPVEMIADMGTRFYEGGMETLDLPEMGHSDPVAPANRRWLYETILAPALGLGRPTEHAENTED